MGEMNPTLVFCRGTEVYVVAKGDSFALSAIPTFIIRSHDSQLEGEDIEDISSGSSVQFFRVVCELIWTESGPGHHHGTLRREVASRFGIRPVFAIRPDERSLLRADVYLTISFLASRLVSLDHVCPDNIVHRDRIEHLAVIG